MMNAVGGTSVHYWAQHWRLNPWDFQVVSATTKRYGASALPAGTTVTDWPFGYDEMEPYYDKVEYEVGVSGKAGNIKGKLDPAGNIFEGPRQREYPMPALRGTGFTDLLDTTAIARLAPVPQPRGDHEHDLRGSPGCEYHGYCSGAGCPIGAKSSTTWTTIPKAQATGNFTVVGRARVMEILVEDNGRATGVRYIKERHEYIQPADAVLVGGFNYENSRLLLLSKSAAHPKGLGNDTGQVGQHYFSHNTSGSVTAQFPFDLNLWYGMPAQGTALDDFADDNFDHSGLGFIGGGLMWFYTGRSPTSTPTANAPTQNWGSAWKSYVNRLPTGRRTCTSRRQRCPTKATSSTSTRSTPTHSVFRCPGSPAPGGRTRRDRLVHPAEGRPIHDRCRRKHGDDRLARADNHADGRVDSCLRRHADRKRPDNERGRSVRVRSRAPNVGTPRRLGLRHEWLP